MKAAPATIPIHIPSVGAPPVEGVEGASVTVEVTVVDDLVRAEDVFANTCNELVEVGVVVDPEVVDVVVVGVVRVVGVVLVVGVALVVGVVPDVEVEVVEFVTPEADVVDPGVPVVFTSSENRSAFPPQRRGSYSKWPVAERSLETVRCKIPQCRSRRQDFQCHSRHRQTR